MKKKSIIFFPKYNNRGPSSRYRIFQFLKYYSESGYSIKVYPFFGNNYFSSSHKSKIFVVLFYYLRRFFYFAKIRRNTLVYIEYELFPFLFPFGEFFLKFFNIKYIVEFDDAIFHRYNKNSNYLIRYFLGKKIDYVIKYASYVITGSPYLTTYVSKINKNVFEIPTSLLISKYQMNEEYFANDKFIIGWIGSKTTSDNICIIKDALYQFSLQFDFELRLIGFDENLKSELSKLNVKYVKWDETTEVQEIQKFTVGIMPLEDNPFNRGKCGFKLIQYMACGKPTISSPLEANLNINKSGQNLHANTTLEWITAFTKIYTNRKYFELVGLDNYKIFCEHYSVEKNHSFYLNIINMVSNVRN